MSGNNVAPSSELLGELSISVFVSSLSISRVANAIFDVCLQKKTGKMKTNQVACRPMNKVSYPNANTNSYSTLRTLHMFIEGGDERRRAMRRDDPRRHTLGGDILVYGNSQHPHAHQMVQQQRAMDLEVSRS